MSKEEVVDCSCDACGKKSTCSYAQNAPPGWFYFTVTESDEDAPEDPPQDITTVLACSERCKTLPWKKQKLDASKRKV